MSENLGKLKTSLALNLERHSHLAIHLGLMSEIEGIRKLERDWKEYERRREEEIGESS